MDVNLLSEYIVLLQIKQIQRHADSIIEEGLFGGWNKGRVIEIETKEQKQNLWCPSDNMTLLLLRRSFISNSIPPHIIHCLVARSPFDVAPNPLSPTRML